MTKSMLTLQHHTNICKIMNSINFCNSSFHFSGKTFHYKNKNDKRTANSIFLKQLMQ